MLTRSSLLSGAVLILVTTSVSGIDREDFASCGTISNSANCDGSQEPPVLNVADFSCFLQRFAAGAAYANCDGSTTPPTINVADFTCFPQQFAVGCP